ncbi:hypothetical protein Tco_0667585, partial [Tanacetum coccineum]
DASAVVVIADMDVGVGVDAGIGMEVDVGVEGEEQVEGVVQNIYGHVMEIPL